MFFLNTLVNIQIVQNATSDQITKGAKIYIDSLSSTPALARMTGGPLVRRMLENMFYWSGVTQELHRLHLPGCSKLCPVRDYEELLRPVLPSE
ncbi:hypothetical protein TSAR_000703 [Trichomalopsis sarcophagae]|uniref:Uncharacterized protein n=1 Tax=Trichomalopsis sarcophagae TaxID=543379 RepID=A0A232FLX7_9HYME|nr:hypothetical protein TSAR_000703 [Trichomalopsis sarcophagae]